MIASFSAGIIFAIAHHVYYKALDSQLAGSAARQQWPLRFGTTFAFLVKVCLTTATGIAYVQGIWTIFRQRAVTIEAIDAAFAANTNVFKFSNWGFLSNFKIPVAIGVILWCLPLSVLVTPATLGVISKPHMKLHNLTVNMPYISSPNVWSADVYTDPGSQLRRAFNALISTGELLHLSAPGGLQNASYSLYLTVPLVRCLPSNDSVISWTMALAYETVSTYGDYVMLGQGTVNDNTPMLNDRNLTWVVAGKTSSGTLTQYGKIGYFGTTANTTFDDAVIPDLWIAIANPPNGTIMDNLIYPPDDPYRDNHPPQAVYNVSYYTCSVLNASVPTNVSFVNNDQSLQIGPISILDYSSDPDNLPALETYSSFAQLLQGYLLGYAVSLMNIDSNGAMGVVRQDWNTSIQDTVLGTAADFAAVIRAWQRDGHRMNEIGQTVQNNKNLTTLIEEFSLNASLSLMSNPIFCNQTMTQVEEELWENQYTYDPKNLLIAYGCSIIACLATVLVGAYALYSNGESHDNNFSTVSNAVQNPNIASLFILNSSNPKLIKRRITSAKIQLIREYEGVERFHLIDS
ncbi:hypothetical protein ACMFMF_008826 [Clarireedia jacksonii]